MATEFVSSGKLLLKADKPITLADLEHFCSEARRMGVQPSALLHTSRQSFMGPLIGWSFKIPVIPKGEQTS